MHGAFSMRKGGQNEQGEIHRRDVCGVAGMADAVDDDYTDRAAGGCAKPPPQAICKSLKRKLR